MFGAFPIGSIYLSVNSTSPASLFGGTWEKIKDKFLLASGDTYSAGATGGEATHTLTIEEMPSHSHVENEAGPNWSDTKVMVSGNQGSGSYEGNQVKGSYITNGLWVISTQPSGGSQAHNNMPPFLVVNVWKRVS